MDWNRQPEHLEEHLSKHIESYETDLPRGGFSENNANTVLPELGERIAVFWPLEEQYCSGTIHSIDPNGCHVVHCDENDIDVLHQTKENSKMDCCILLSIKVITNVLESNEHDFLSDMLAALRSPPFLRYQAKGLTNQLLLRPTKKEEAKLP